MSYRRGHRALTEQGYAWLAALADPVGKEGAPDRPMLEAELSVLVDAAAAHGILPAMARNVRRLFADLGPSAIVSGPDAGRRVAETLAELDRRIVLLTGHSLLLAHHAQRVAAALADRALPASIVKGPVFSRRLFPQPSDRGFTDIDILVDTAALDAIADILTDLGFRQAFDSNRDPLGHGEYKWVLPGNGAVLVEVQTNLIHSPNLGKGLRFRHHDLLAAGAGDPEDATALLLVAAIHGAAGHQFERLQPAVDVLQAARGAAGPIDRIRLARVSAAVGATAALQTALDISARLFDEPKALEIANALAPAPWRLLRRALLSPAVALRAQTDGAGRDSWRRGAVREIFRRVGRPAGPDEGGTQQTSNPGHA